MSSKKVMSVKIGDQTRTATRMRDGKWWITPGETPLLNRRQIWTLTDKDNNEFKATLQYTQISHLCSSYPAVIRLMPLISLKLHEDFDANNFNKVRTTQYWHDQPLLAGVMGNLTVLLDGVTRWGKLYDMYNDPNLLVPVQLVDPFTLELNTWLDPQDILTIEQVWTQFVAKGTRVKPRQTRFGISIGEDLVVSDAEVQPIVTFHQPFLPPHPGIKLRR